MAAQWPLMLATMVAGLGGWLLAAACGHVVAAGRGVRVRVRPPHALAFVLSVAACVAAIVIEGVSLGSASALFQLLSRPGSPLFAFMASLVAGIVVPLVALTAAARGMGSAALRVLAILGLATGVALVVCGSLVFLPSTYEAWNTPLMPFALAGVEAAGGGCCALALTAALAKPDMSSRSTGSPIAEPALARRPLKVRLAPPATLAVLGCVAAVATAAAFVGRTGFGGEHALLWGLCTLGACVASLACSAAAWALRSRKGVCTVLAVVAFALGLFAAIALRLYLGEFAVRQFSLLNSPMGRL